MLLGLLWLCASSGAYGHGFDVFVVAMLSFGALQGGFRGLTGEVARVAGLLVGIAVGFGISESLGACATAWFPGEHQTAWRGLVMILGILLAATLAGRVVIWCVDRFLGLLLDQPANAVLGVLAGALRSALWLVAFLFLASFFAFGEFGRMLFEESLAGRTARPVVHRLRAHLGVVESPWVIPSADWRPAQSVEDSDGPTSP